MIYIFLADGFEEVEALFTLDVLRRAELDVKTVHIGSKGVIFACHQQPAQTVRKHTPCDYVRAVYSVGQG